MHHSRKLTWTLTVVGAVLLLGASGLAPRAGNAAAPTAEPPPAAASIAFASPAIQVPGDPISVERDKEGYTVWTYDYSAGSWCVMYSRLRWPFRLGGQDPSELSNTSLILNWGERPYALDGGGNPLYTDPTWGVGLNGKPTGWSAETGFTGEWNLIGSVGTAPTYPLAVPAEQVVNFDSSTLQDGENNLWFQQQDFCNCPGLEDCACTCYKLTGIKLRGMVNLGIKSISPEPETPNVWTDQRKDSVIRVKFTTLISTTTMTPETFQVYYYDQDLNKVYVEGKIVPISATEFAFTPIQELRDGIRYVAQVWGENDALLAGHDEWVKDVSGGPLEDGQLWFFWTLPKLQVTLLPVQVLENQTLIINKPTVLRAFIRWDTKTDVFWRHQAPKVTLDDLAMAWADTSGQDTDAKYWSTGGSNWLPGIGPQTVQRKREYREFTRIEESYTNRERYMGVDSVNFFGFTPLMTGGYHLTARALVTDSQGRPHAFTGSATLDSVAVPTFNLRFKALAVGVDFGKTGVVNLTTPIEESLRGFRALFPVSGVRTHPVASAVPYYNPTTPLWFYDWSTEPGGFWPKKYLLEELSRLCLRDSRCDVMVGFTPTAWPGADGLTLPETAPYSAFVKNDVASGTQYIMAHEIGHLATFEHIETPAAEGYNVRRRMVMRYSIDRDVFDFMTANPVEAADKFLWVTQGHYTSLGTWTGAWSAQARAATLSADPLLLVAGVITETTGATRLLPWYQLDPGEWTAPAPGPFRIVFLNASNQEITGYTRSFGVAAELQPAGEPTLAPGEPAMAPDEPAPFVLAIPYPAATAKIQVQRIAGSAVLAEVVLATTAPALTLTPPPATWQGAQAVAWTSNAGTRFYAVDISTDGGMTWQALAIDLTTPNFTIQTTALQDTAQAHLRVSVTDGLRTTTRTAGPFTINNPPLVTSLEPYAGATGVSTGASVSAGFRDAMNPATLNASTFTLTGPQGAVPGAITTDATATEVTFTPQAPLTYGASYTARLTTGITDATGQPLPAAKTWTFTTEADTAPPTPLALAPADGVLDVPRRVHLAVAFDRAVKASTLTASTFQLATAQGVAVTGAVSYDAATRVGRFAPTAPLAPNTLYIATLKAGIQSTAGHATPGDTSWSFTTGSDSALVFALTGGYADEGRDANRDGLYEQLVIRVSVQVTATGTYALRGALTDTDGGEITSTYITRTLASGAHFLELPFDGAAIGGHGADGPYTLTDLTFSRDTGATTSDWNATRTFAYPVSRFPAPLRLSGLPDVVLLPENTFLSAFNVRDYAHHSSLPGSALTYTVRFNSQPRVDVTLQATGRVDLRIEPYWRGSSEVTLRVTDGVTFAQDTFSVLAGWTHSLYLPLVLRDNTGSAVASPRSAWALLINDGFESESLGWHRSGWASNEGPPPPGGFGWYLWGLSTCRVYAGEKSAWAYGGGDDGSLLPCRAPYPDTYSIGTALSRTMPVNLKYAGKGEFTAKVWTNLAPDDNLCLEVGLLDPGAIDCDTGVTHGWYGACRTGQSNGWQDLRLNLAQVPTLGNVLGRTDVCVRVAFKSDIGDSRPEGAYVDEVMLRVCPAGLEGYCGAASAEAPGEAAPAAALVTGSIGGYAESITESTLAIDATGRIHALWTGQLNPAFENFLFYSTSTDGINWTPYQILDAWSAYDPQIAVDNVHGRVHLVYGNLYDGIMHRVVVNGVPGAATVAVPRREFNQPGLNLPSGGLIDPRIAVAQDSGVVHLSWQEGYYKQLDAITYSFRRRAWVAYWNNGAWSAPQRKINDPDTAYVSIAAAPGGSVLMAWFQQWAQLASDGINPGQPIVARTAYGNGTTLGRLALRQATHALYEAPERDESILLTYAPGAGSYVLASTHFMWPGHTRTYRYIWSAGAWSDPLSVAENVTGVSAPQYVGAATNSAVIRYVYTKNTILTTRTETNGVLGPEQTIGNYLSSRGYSAAALAYFTGADGGLHLLVQGEKDGVPGFYYVRP